MRLPESADELLERYKRGERLFTNADDTLASSSTVLRRNLLYGVRLNSASLSCANLSGANLSHAQFSQAEFGQANLDHANLRGADLSRADMSRAQLLLADLRDANLSGADLREADLVGADLRGANLFRADLSRAALLQANLRGSSLLEANLSGVCLRDADLHGAKVGWAVFGSLDLSQVRGLDALQHEGPSTVGIDTLYESKDQIPEAFLRGCGVPDSFITYMASLVGQPFEFYSCFISYSSKDEEFAKRLHARLQHDHLRVWFAPEEMKGGCKLHEQIDEAIRLYDKLLLVLSPHSMASRWVQREILKARQKEERDGVACCSPSASARSTSYAPGSAWTPTRASTSPARCAATSSPTSRSGRITTPSRPASRGSSRTCARKRPRFCQARGGGKTYHLRSGTLPRGPPQSTRGFHATHPPGSPAGRARGRAGGAEPSAFRIRRRRRCPHGHSRVPQSRPDRARRVTSRSAAQDAAVRQSRSSRP